MVYGEEKRKKRKKKRNSQGNEKVMNVTLVNESVYEGVFVCQIERVKDE